MKVINPRRILKFFVMVFAILYFFIDAIFFSILKRTFARIGRLPISIRVAEWIASLGPYQSLVLFLIPLVILEPVKPVSVYLIAKGKTVFGLSVLIVGEILKVAIVERLFHATREKLLLISAFAWIYNFLEAGLDYIQHLPGWQYVLGKFRTIKATARSFLERLRRRRKRN
jgi:hypothetical protein